MSLLTQQASINANEAYFLRANAKQLNVSTLNAATISSAQITTSSLYADYLSTTNLFADAGTISTFSTFEIVIDSQTLNATPTELLLNGIPVATQSSLSSIADWSLDPAINDVDMNGYNIMNASTISCITLVADRGIMASNLRVANGLFDNLVAYNSLFVSSNTSTISSVIDSADLGLFSSIEVYSGLFSTIDAPEITSLSSINGVPLQTYENISTFSTLEVSSLTAGLVSTPQLYVSSINGSEFTSTGIVVQVAGVSSLVANSISSVGAEIRQALMSSIVFSPSLNPSLGGVNVNLGLGGILGNVIGWGAGVFGAAAGTVGLVTGMTALAMGRQSQTFNSTNYELVNGTTQLQFSTLGSQFSTIYRLNNSADPQSIPGEEILVSTISPPGVAVRSISDPLYTLSTPNSTIQAFGQWVPVPSEIVNVSSFADASISSLSVSSINGSVYPPVIPGNEDWAIYPAVSTIAFSTGVTAVVAASAGSDIALTGTSIKLIGGYTDAQNLLLASTISTATILGANDNLFGLGVQGLELRTAPTGQVWISSPQTNIAGLTNTSTLGAVNIQARNGGISSLQVSSLSFAQTGAYGLSSLITLSTSATASGTSTSMIINTDLNIGTNDLFAGQIRLNAGASQNAAEIFMTGPDGRTEAIDLQTGDPIFRNRYGTNAAISTGYLLDTYGNAPFFSTINNTSTAMMALFPSTTSGTIGVSTISIIPVSFQTTSAFSGTLLYPNISSSAVAPNIVASTTIQTNARGSYVIAQANTSFQNAGNQYHDIYLNLAIDGVLSPSTFTSLPAGTNHYANGSIAFRQAVSSGTHTLVLYASADADGVAVGTQVDIWGTGNLAP